MHGQVEPRERRVVAEPLDDLQRVGVLRIDRPGAVHEGVVAVHRADLGDQRHELGLQVVEDLAHLGGLHARLVVVEESVVGLVVALEAVDVAALQVDRALEHGAEELVVVLGPRLRPHVVGLDGGAGHLGSQLGGDAARLLPVAARRADQARVVRVVVELLLVVGELVEQRADRRRRRTSRARSGRASSPGARERRRRRAASSRSGPRTGSPACGAGRGSRPNVSSARRNAAPSSLLGSRVRRDSSCAAQPVCGTRGAGSTGSQTSHQLGGHQMGIIAFIILGAIAGAIAKALLPGDDPGGFIVTTIIGVVGAILGGFLARRSSAPSAGRVLRHQLVADGDRRLDHPAASSIARSPAAAASRASWSSSGSKARGWRPRGNVRTAVSPQPSSRQMYVRMRTARSAIS